MPIRSNPASTGAGLRLATEATSGPSDAGFYGHLVLADVPLDEPMQFANQKLYYSEHTLAFNRHGERFIDERRSATTSRPWPRSSNRTLERSSWPISASAMSGRSAPTSRA